MEKDKERKEKVTINDVSREESASLETDHNVPPFSSSLFLGSFTLFFKVLLSSFLSFAKLNCEEQKGIESCSQRGRWGYFSLSLAVGSKEDECRRIETHRKTFSGLHGPLSNPGTDDVHLQISSHTNK